MPSTSLVFLVCFATSVFAQTSLFIPGFDPQPISADILGVESGRTTWALHKGAVTGTFDDSGFIGTATLVEGPNDASFTYADEAGGLTLGTECSLSGDLAICSATVSGNIVTETETADRFAIQAGTTAPAASAQTSQPTSQPTAGAPANTSSKPSEKTTSIPAPTHTSKARTLELSFSYLFISAAAMTLFMRV